MKAWGVAMVRNEADIIETFVRHNLTLLDGLAIVDHHSADATMAIVNALAREGLPLLMLASDAVGYAQQEVTSAAVRHTFAATGADFVFPLDADEFVKTPSRAHLTRALAALPPGGHGVMTWHTYMPDFAAPYRDAVASARAARRLAEEHFPHGKVVLSRHFLKTPRAVVTGGNHAVKPWPDAPAKDWDLHYRFAPRDLAVAHLPYRNGPQFIAKTVVKRLARVAAGRDWSADFDRREAYADIAAGRLIDAAYLRAATVNLNVARDRRVDAAAVALVDDPFIADFPLRHTPPEAADALPLVLAAVEEFARREAQARAARATTPSPATAHPRAP